MSIPIYFYAFAKKENSTARPTTAAATFNCELINSCSILYPRIILQGANAAYNPYRLNYAYIPEFDRYYYVSDWTWDSGLWYASCDIDALASWKIGIGQNSQYISRCSTAYDGTINDGLFPAENVITTSRTFMNPDASTWGDSATLNSGLFIMAVINNLNADVTEKNIVTYYAMTPAQFGVVSEALFTGDFWDRVVAGTAKFNDYILGLQWIPYAPANLGTIGELRPTVVIGNWPLVNAPAYLVKRSNIKMEFSFTSYAIPRHPQAAQYGAYMNCSPWSSYYLYWPPVGRVELDSQAIAENAVVTVRLTVDIRTGGGMYNITCGDNFIGSGCSQFSMALPVASLSVDFSAIGNALSNFGGAAAEAAKINWRNAAIAFGESVGSLVDASTPDAKNSGSYGNAALLTAPPVVYARHVHSVPHDPDRGRPYCQTRTINELTGAYMVIPAPHFELNCTSGELQIIHSFASGGFYYE